MSLFSFVSAEVAEKVMEWQVDNLQILLYELMICESLVLVMRNVVDKVHKLWNHGFVSLEGR